MRDTLDELSNRLYSEATKVADETGDHEDRKIAAKAEELRHLIIARQRA